MARSDRRHHVPVAALCALCLLGFTLSGGVEMSGGVLASGSSGSPPQSAFDHGDLQIGPNLIFRDTDSDGTDDARRWSEFDTTTYIAARDTWPKYDVTCDTAPCASGLDPYTDDAGMAGCAAVTTAGANGFGNVGCHIAGSTKPVDLKVPDGTYGHASSNLKITADNWQLSAVNEKATFVETTWTGAGAGSGICTGTDAPKVLYVCNPNLLAATAATWSGGYAKGDTVLTVASGHGLIAGDDMIAYMDTNTACEKFARLTASGGQQTDATFHHTTVASSTATTVTLEDPLPMDYDGAGCTGHAVQAIDYLNNVGIVGIAFRATALTYAESSVQKVTFKGVRNGWFVGGELARSDDEAIRIAYSRDVWVQGNWVHDNDPTISANTEGVRPVRSRHVVIENNYFSDISVASKIEIGTHGVVVGYNRVTNDQRVDEPAFFTHGFRARQTLYEGNDSEKRIELADRFWDSNEGVFVAYANRQRWTGNECTHASSIHVGKDQACPTPGSNCASEVPGDPDFRWSIEGDAVLIANVVNSVYTSPRAGSCPPLNTGSNRSLVSAAERVHLERNVLHHSEFVKLTGGAGGDPGTVVLNADNVFSADAAPAGWASDTAPVSLYHDDRPSWWPASPPAGVCAWGTDKPSVGAFVDDFNGGSPTYCKLPAECYWVDGDAACSPI